MIDDTLAGKIILAEQLGKKTKLLSAKSDVDCAKGNYHKSNEQYTTY